MKRLKPTDILTAAHVEAIIRDIENFDIAKLDADQVKPRPRRQRPLLSPGFRRVHVEPNGNEREPLDGEPYMIIEREGDFETTIMPWSFDGGRMYVPRFGGPWEITEVSDNKEWIIWIRLAKGVRS
jgi:hypothetical protein